MTLEWLPLLLASLGLLNLALLHPDTPTLTGLRVFGSSFVVWSVIPWGWFL